jgi:hypothetical protein
MATSCRSASTVERGPSRPRRRPRRVHHGRPSRIIAIDGRKQGCRLKSERRSPNFAILRQYLSRRTKDGGTFRDSAARIIEAGAPRSGGNRTSAPAGTDPVRWGLCLSSRKAGAGAARDGRRHVRRRRAAVGRSECCPVRDSLVAGPLPGQLSRGIAAARARRRDGDLGGPARHMGPVHRYCRGQAAGCSTIARAPVRG